MNVWKSWTESKGQNNDIVKYQAKELNEYPWQFFVEIRKIDDLVIISVNYFILFSFNRLT